ncbi:DUF4129 domain-containing protein [Myceligenerans pegani]|uniref:DUF4129 domain-containing protein n=1 Tax=Myceligenerans pegani TaxID=2776917 RepID=A0ABR9MVF8_9MICO|nr:DUF4129 domain-containing protein [Myceligenerans sp. TRM 65318]MBE1874914.1 DUF4129 domain-containing protein [Myceligenerans sp. TRM 65318]MBE3017185.1 DUF4129 domain-containing protein [Myceligenerans sp. TRM 65318]
MTATVLLVLVVLAAAAATPWVAAPPRMPAILPTNPADLPSMPPVPTASPTPAPQEYLNDTARNLIGIALLLVLLALLAWIGTVIARRMIDRYQPGTTVPEETPAPGGTVTATPDELTAAVQDAVEQALAVVDRARGVPRDAVVAAWVALEDAAAAHGTERDPADTPTEFTAALLAATPAPAADIRTLRALYQRARFTTRPVTDDDVAAARAALAGIARALDRAGAR